MKDKNTFANASVEKAPSTRPHSSDYHFEEDNLIYHDTYFGNRDFIGEEIVYQDQNPVWGMNYYGYILAGGVTNKELSTFLERSIMQEYDDVIPVRGPKEFHENNWTYKLTVDGDISRFSGKEEISRNGEVVYRLFLFGGFIT
ncbi:XRE family transcriptional regulator [Candidatus Uhrbacteria bacterium]|nr:XRE family transcriptional regulator [Candidatus Uhrbacteria bacterium]